MKSCELGSKDVDLGQQHKKVQGGRKEEENENEKEAHTAKPENTSVTNNSWMGCYDSN